MTYTLRISAAAKTELAESVAWYATKGKVLATGFETELRVTVDVIRQHPLAFAVVSGHVRKANLHTFPYSLFYDVRGRTIRLLAVLHHSRYSRFGH